MSNPAAEAVRCAFSELEQINSAKGNEAHLKNRKEALSADIGQRGADRDRILEEKRETEGRLGELEAVRSEAAALLSDVLSRIEELNANIESGKNTIINELNERATIKSRMGRYDTMMEQVQIRKAELNSRLLRAKSDETQQEENIKELELEFLRINDNISKLNESQSLTEERLNEIRDEMAAKDQKLRDTQVIYHQKKSKLEALTNLTERYEGYGGSIKRVMEQKEGNPGIIGVVADLLKVDARYEVAIETALGGSIQNIVTDNEETAKRMIGFLKTNKAGRATFLPLTSIRNRQEFRQREVLSEQGVLGLADTLVRVDERYRDVASSLLGRILVVENVDQAVRIARKYGYCLRMVTLEGELFTPGGAISGGAFRNSSNLWGRRREIEELEKAVTDTLRQVDTLLDEIEQTKKRRNSLRMELEQVKSSLQQEFIHQNTARMNVASAREKREKAGQGFEDLQKEQMQIAAQMEEIHSDKERIRGQLEASEKLEEDVKKRISEAEKELEGLREEEAGQAARVAEWDVEVEKIRQKQGFEQTNLERVEGEIHRFTQELEEVQSGLDQRAEEIETRLKDIQSLQETILASHTSQTDGEKKLKEDVARKELLAAQQKNFFADRESLADRQAGLDKEVYRLNAQREKLEESVESQINYMWDEYEITLSDAAALRDESMQDLAAMKKEIASLKDQIRKLGDVNVNAIEDYKNLMERFTFLKNQHDDLVAAEETLVGVIKELDEAMRRQFKEKFAQIGQEFDKVFRELFGGGKGTLELMEDEDILEAGIRIIAQPPGKKLQNMMQLSGGEKALTAISLLFAIQNLKPSPFCLLDEIEAALDDSNVGRFAGYLHKLTKHTQFIVITHRRGTMEKADRLYGITMQEKGISTLVSVSLIDKELDN